MTQSHPCCAYQTRARVRAEVGFADEELPEWFYSPARAVKKEQAVVPCSDAAVPSSDELSEAQEALPSSVKRVHEPVTPRNPIPRERGSGRPPLTEQSSTELNTAPDNSEELDRAQDSSEFSEEELDQSSGQLRVL